MNTAISKIFALFIGLMLLTLSFGVNGQSRSLTDRMPSNRWSLEAKYGGGFPFVNGEDEAGNNYYNKSTTSYSIGLRYMLTHTFGMRTNYHHHYFSSYSENPTLSTHTFGLHAVYSFSGFLPEGRISNPRKINILAYGGGGYTIGNGDNSRDRIISGTIGASLQYRISSFLALNLDPITFQFNSFQDKRFSPANVSITAEDNITRLFQPEVFWYPSIGVQFYLGKWGNHVDWR